MSEKLTTEETRGAPADGPDGVVRGVAPASRPVAELEDATPRRTLTLKEFKGAVILPPGEPMMVGNVWLAYPGRRVGVNRPCCAS